MADTDDQQPTVKINPFTTCFSQHVKNAFLVLLRAAYSSSTTPKEYYYDPTGKQQTSILIDKAWPRRLDFPTSLIVEITRGSSHRDFLGGKEVAGSTIDSQNILTHMSFLGKNTYTVKINIACKSADDRDRITDQVDIYVRHLFCKKLFELHIGYSDIAVEGDSQDFQSSSVASGLDEVIYRNAVIVETISEYNQDIPISVIELIDKVQVNVTPVLSL